MLLLLSIPVPYSKAVGENLDILRVSLPVGTVVGSSDDPWLNEGWLLNLTGKRWTFTLRVSHTIEINESYDTHLVIALNNAAYNSLIELMINNITIPKTAFRKGIPKPYNTLTWPNDVYPAWFNDTYVNLGALNPYIGYKEANVSVTFSNTTDVRMHFDAYGKLVPCTTPPRLDEIIWSSNSQDSTVMSTPEIPVARFRYTPIAPLVYEIVTFNASDSYDPDGWIVSYQWEFGDGNVTRTANPTITHTYWTIGDYIVVLTVTDNDGKSASTSAVVHVKKGPVAYFTYSPEAPLVNQEVTFDATFSAPDGGYIVNYAWDFGDGTPLSMELDPVAVHIYSNSGTYNATLTVTDSEGLSDTTSRTIHVIIGPPRADFFYSPSYPLVCHTVTFNASASTPNGGYITAYNWNFGDGNVTTTADPIITHHYLEAGTYNVTLSVEDSEGSTDATWKILSVRAPPWAAFTYSPQNPYANQTVTFDASASEPDGGIIVQYQWDFGDGTIINETDPVTNHAYSAVGSYNVTLTITDSEELTDIAFRIVDVSVRRLRAEFSYSPLFPTVCLTITFNASGSTPNGGHITTYSWNFGDGNITATADSVIRHHYTTRGTYNVTLSIEDSEGSTDTAWKMLSVREPPKAAFTYFPTSPNVDQTVTFDASASEPNGGTIVWYYWDFGDGTDVNETDPVTSHAYAPAGTYDVSLTVGDTEGLSDVALKTVTVVMPTPPRSPVARFTEVPTITYVGQYVTFDASSSKSGFDGVKLCPIVWYYWHFGDGATANETDPITTHTYFKAGTYNVNLTVYAPGVSPEYYPYDSTWHTVTVSVPVGGYAVPINKFNLMIRWIGPASIAVVAIVLTVVFVKRRSKTVT